ncbi:MAG: hypothetical protein SVU94_12645 [Bacteroidota bacterium]|nr:hypothetical protein [Bacteroidota bacterium]
MKAQESNFKVENIFITESNFNTIPIKESKKLNRNLELDIDFDIKLTNKDNKELFLIKVILIGNNKSKPIPGYVFQVIAQGVFSFESEPEKTTKDNYLLMSGLPLIINTIRAYILNVTAYFPYGKYIIPLIDVNNLIRTKTNTKNNKQKTEK